MRERVTLVLALCITLITIHAQPDNTPTANDAWAELERVMDGPRPDHFRSHFEQTRTSPLLDKPVVSEGEVIVVDDRSLWTLSDPEPIIMGVDRDTMTILYVEADEAEIYDLRSMPGVAGMGPNTDPALLRDLCDAKRAEWIGHDKDARFKITLTPREGVWGGTIDELILVIEPERRVLESITTIADDSQTTLSFLSIEEDTTLTPEDAELELPPGTTIFRPSLEIPSGTEGDGGP